VEGGLFVTIEDMASPLGAYPDNSTPPYLKYKTRKLFLNRGSLNAPRLKDDFYSAPSNLNRENWWYHGNKKKAVSWRSGVVYINGRFFNLGGTIFAAALTQWRTSINQPLVDVVVMLHTTNQVNFNVLVYSYIDDPVQSDRLLLTQRFSFAVTYTGSYFYARFSEDGYALMFWAKTSTTQFASVIKLNPTTLTATNTAAFQMDLDLFQVVSSSSDNDVITQFPTYKEKVNTFTFSSSENQVNTGGKLLLARFVGSKCYFLYEKVSSSALTETINRTTVSRTPTANSNSFGGALSIVFSQDSNKSRTHQLSEGVFDIATNEYTLLSKTWRTITGSGSTSADNTYLAGAGGSSEKNKQTGHQFLAVYGYYPKNGILLMSEWHVATTLSIVASGTSPTITLTSEDSYKLDASVYVVNEQGQALVDSYNQPIITNSGSELAGGTGYFGLASTTLSLEESPQISASANWAENGKVLLSIVALGTTDRMIYAGVDLNNPTENIYVQAEQVNNFAYPSVTTDF
jgi:hypothetical protein